MCSVLQELEVEKSNRMMERKGRRILDFLFGVARELRENSRQKKQAALSMDRLFVILRTSHIYR